MSRICIEAGLSEATPTREAYHAGFSASLCAAIGESNIGVDHFSSHRIRSSYFSYNWKSVG